MYAVIRTGGKQYRVAENQRVTVEKLPGEPGDTVKLDDVLMIAEGGGAPLFGAPILDKAAVFAEVVAQTRGDKITVFKKKRRKNYRRKKGHRQDLTLLRIATISASGEAPAVKRKPAKENKAAEPAFEATVESSATDPKNEDIAAAPAAKSNPVAETTSESESKE